MKNFYLTQTPPSEYDLTVVNNNLAFTTNNTDYMAQKIINALKTYKGEFFLNSTLGVPYFTDILKKGVDMVTVKAILVAAVAGIQFVKEVVSLEMSYDSENRIISGDLTVLLNNDELLSLEI